MAQALPVTPDEMRTIDQVTSVRYSKYGEDFLEVTIKYATILASELESRMLVIFRVRPFYMLSNGRLPGRILLFSFFVSDCPADF